MLSLGNRANIKHVLQEELFNNDEEKVLSVCTVTKTFKKKKFNFLVITSNTNLHSAISIHQVKPNEKDSGYKKKRTWQLIDIKFVDAKSDARDIHEFDIHLDKIYKWYAISLHERQNFLAVLFRNSKANKIEFRNMPSLWLNEKQLDEKCKQAPDIVEDNLEGECEDFQALTEKEIIELDKLVSKCDYAIKDAELFIEELGKQLHLLDGENIQSVLTSENQVKILMAEIENAINEADTFEKCLNGYDEILGHARETMEKMGGKNAMIETANMNNIKLLNELNQIVTQLDIPYHQQLTLCEPDLKTQTGLEAAISAAKCLQAAMNSDIDPSMQRLSAVQDQQKRFEKWKGKFLQAISRHLNNLFIHLGNDLADIQLITSDLTLPSHAAVHKELSIYTELMHWVKAMSKKAYDGLIKVYSTSLNKIYDRELKHFFQQARTLSSGINASMREDLNTSNSKTKNNIVPYGLLGINKEFWPIGVLPSEREKFDTTLEKILTELEPIALQEQTFCTNFFQLNFLNLAKTTQVAGDNVENENEKCENEPQKKLDKQINEDVRRMMMSLFSVLENELLTFIQNFEKLDVFFSMNALVRLTQHVMSAQDTHSFLSMTFASALVHVKRNFDRLMQQQLQSIKDSKVPKKSKCGILAYVENFEEFSQTAEEIFRRSDRRTDMDKWYIQLVNVIFNSIPIHAMEHPKTPNQVVKMENYHHMHALLSQLKVPVLENLKKEAKLRYNDSLKAYVTKYFGRPLEKLNLFFEGVQQKVAQGVKETEISYQMVYSKQELRKIISHYPAREVKKGLENLYKKVEKHLSEEENLLQVVWHAMQEEFIAQYNFLEERIQKCYAGAMISLDFTIHDILTFFSDIAKSH